MLEKKEGGRYDGWISYTYCVSKRKLSKNIGYYDPSNIQYYDPYNRDPLTIGEWYYPDYDQRHSLSAVLNYKVDEKWSVYNSIEFHSGRPYTEVTGPLTVAVTNPYTGVTTTEYLPVKEEYNGSRFPYYLRLDLKAIQSHTFLGLRAESYIEFINLFARENVKDYYYTDNYTTKKALTNFPLLIIAGIKVYF
jgi:hypothetical protein